MRGVGLNSQGNNKEPLNLPDNRYQVLLPYGYTPEYVATV